MTIERQNVPIVLNQGVDTKTDPKQMVTGKVVTLENAYMQTTNEYKKRNGYSALGTNTSLGAGNAVASYNSELAIFDNASLYSYSASQNTKNSKGTKIAVDLSIQPVVRNTYQQTVPDSAYDAASGLQVFAYEDSSGGVKYTVIDYATQQILVNNTAVSSTGIKPKVFFFSSKFIIIYGDSSANTLSYKTITTSTPTSISGATTITSDFNSSYAMYDVVLNSSLTRLYFVWNSFAASKVTLVYLDSSFVLQSSTDVSGNDANLSISLAIDTSNNQVWCVLCNSSSVVKYFVRNSSLVLVLAATTIEDLTTQLIAGQYNGGARNIITIPNSGSATTFYEVIALLQDNATTNPSKQFIRSSSLTNAGVVSGTATVLRSVGLASKPFTYSSSTYFLVTHQSTEQSTYFLVKNSATIVAKLAPTNGGGLTAKRILPEVNTISSTVFQVPYLIKDFLTAVSGSIFTQTGVNSALFTFTAPITNVVIGGDLHSSGALPTIYDGAQVVEDTFNLYPEDIFSGIQQNGMSTTVQSLPFGGFMSNGTYNYTATYEWTDNQGQIYRSATTTPISIAVPSNYVTSGDTTSGSNTITGMDSETISLFNTGYTTITGSGIPVGATVSSIGTSSIVISANATATASNVSLTLAAQRRYAANITAGSKIVQMQPILGFYIYAKFTNGSPIVYVNDTTYVKVGMKLNGVLINSISGNAVTLASNASTTVSNFCVQILFSTGANATATIGSPIIGNVPSAFYAGLSVGTTVSMSTGFGAVAFPYLKVVSLNPASNQITVNINATGTTSVSVLAIWNPAENFVGVGQNYTNSTYFTSGTVVESVGTYNSTTQTTPVVFSNPALATGSSQTLTTGNVAGVAITVPYLGLTSKSNVSLALYRTEDQGSLYYRVTSPTSPTINSTTLDYATINVPDNDGKIIGNEQLYTTGGVLDNDGLPATSFVFPYKNRMIALLPENSNTALFSKSVTPGVPCEFSSSLAVTADPKGGALTTGIEMDEKCILFKKRNICYFSGNGPGNTGLNNDFSDPIYIPTDTGVNATNKKSVLLTPVGVMYKSDNGIYLLDRSLSVEYIGADVEAYNSSNVTSSHLVPSVTQAWFTLDSGVFLVYDYFNKQWSVYKNLSAVDSVLYNDLITYITSTGSVLQENLSSFTDNGTFIPIKFVTSWLNLAGIQGFQRVRSIEILGDYKSAHTITVGLGYDFVASPSQSTAILTSSAPTGAYQYSVRCTRQKCESLQITITETQSVPYGEGLSLSNLALNVGVKKGLNKLPAASTYG